MLSVVETLQLAIDSFNSIKAAIEEKGVQVGDKPKSEYSILISQIKSDTSDLEAQIENLQGQVNSLSSQVEQLTNEKNSLSEQVGTLTSQNSTLQSSLDSQTAELRSKTATLSTYTGYLKSIGENIKTKGGTITEKDFSTYAGGVLTISSEDTTKVNELQTQVNELTSQVERLTTDKNNLNDIINIYKTIFANIKSAIETKGGTVGEDYSSYAQAILNLNITGSSEIAFNNLSSSPIILYVKFTHTGKATGVADPEFKVGTIDLSSIDINKDYLPRYINAFVNSYPCVISLRTTDNINIYDIYYDGNAIPESVGATNFVVKFNQIIGFKN